MPNILCDHIYVLYIVIFKIFRCGFFKCVIVCILTGPIGLSPRLCYLPPLRQCARQSRATQAVSSEQAELPVSSTPA